MSIIYKEQQRSASYNPCVPCVSTCVSVHHLISVYILTTLISQAGKNNEYFLVFEALLNLFNLLLLQ